MTFASRLPAVFSHHGGGSRAADRPDAPFMGGGEVEFRRLWSAAFTPVRSHLASPAFADQLGRSYNEVTVAHLVDAYIDHAGDLLLQVEPALQAAVIDGGRNAEGMYGLSVLSALAVQKGVHRNPFRAGTEMHARWNQRYGVNVPPRAPGTPTLDPYLQYVTVAKKLTLNMVDGITYNMKRSVRRIIADGISRKERPEFLGARIGAVIGLHDRWARAVENMRAQMVASGKYRPDVITRRCLKYGETLLVKRGEMVARTETARAVNAGRQQYWLDRQERGDLEGFTVVKRWIAKPGCCDECEATSDANAAGVPDRVDGLEAPFVTPYGPVMYPPLHPNCRCFVDYEIVRG